MNARWRARVSASQRADACSSASRQSRMSFKTVTAPALRQVLATQRAGTPPFIVAAPCQSELKLTLRRACLLAEARARRPHLRDQGAVSALMVNAGFPQTALLWFRNGSDAAAKLAIAARA